MYPLQNSNSLNETQRSRAIDRLSELICQCNIIVNRGELGISHHSFLSALASVYKAFQGTWQIDKLKKIKTEVNVFDNFIMSFLTGMSVIDFICLMDFIMDLNLIFKVCGNTWLLSMESKFSIFFLLHLSFGILLQPTGRVSHNLPSVRYWEFIPRSLIVRR